MKYLSNRIKTAIEILELEIKKDEESLKSGSYKDSPRYSKYDGELLRMRLKGNIQEKHRLERQLNDNRT